MAEDIQNQKSRKQNAELLKRIRDRYTYASVAWKDVREEAKTDMRYVSGDPWTEDDKKARANRPLIAPDELNQYLNQAINNLRQNKRGIKVSPASEDATDQTAELHENLIRAIEDESQAQRNAYIPAFENSCQRSYGYFRISRQYASSKSFDQVIRIKGILNPDCVLYDPDCKEADWSDARYVFVAEPMPHDEFESRFPDAKTQDFTEDMMGEFPDWIREDHVIVAEYWEAQQVTRELLMVETPEGPQAFYRDELPEELKKAKVIKSRKAEGRKIVQYLTNGIEILEHTEQPGEFIPIVAVIGKEIYVDEGGGPKRKLLSMVRLARDPQKLYAFLCSQEAEEAKLTPKIPVIGYKGQFEADRDTWDTLTEVPHAYAQVDPVVDETNQVLPLPQWKQYTPNFQAYEIAKDGARRAIQAAMGITPLPTAAQRNNEKSGVALDRISSQESLGSFHFTDNFDRALEFAGRIIEGWLPVVYDAERVVGLKKPDDSHYMAKLNTQEPYPHPEDGSPQHFPVDAGEHRVTVSTQPSYQSQREEISDFLDRLIEQLPTLGFPATVTGPVMALAVQMRNMGPKGDQIAEILDPKNDQAGALQQAQQQIAQNQQDMQLVMGELQKLKLEKAGKIIDNEYQLQQQKMANDIKVLIALITAKNQQAQQEAEMYAEFRSENHDAAHDIALQKDQQGHEAQMAQAQQAHDRQQVMAQHAATMEQQVNQAALAPPPAPKQGQ